MKTQDEIDEIRLGKAVERLRTNPDFIRVIEQEFLINRLLVVGKTFTGSNEEIDIIKSVASLDQFLNGLIETAKMNLNQEGK